MKAEQEKLLSELGDLIRMEGLSFGEDEQCLLCFDEDFFVCLKVSDTGFHLLGMLLSGEEAGLAGFPAAAWLLRKILSWNMKLAWRDQGTVAFDENSDALLLVRTLPLGGLDANTLCQELTTFLETLEESIRHFAGLSGEALEGLARLEEEERETAMSDRRGGTPYA